MTDIVERLRAYPEDWDGSVMSEAANEIERCYGEIDHLRSETWERRNEIERLRALLRAVLENEFAAVPYIDYRAIRAALAEAG